MQDPRLWRFGANLLQEAEFLVGGKGDDESSSQVLPVALKSMASARAVTRQRVQAKITHNPKHLCTVRQTWMITD